MSQKANAGETIRVTDNKLLCLNKNSRETQEANFNHPQQINAAAM